jgi:hypothetical protein
MVDQIFPELGIMIKDKLASKTIKWIGIADQNEKSFDFYKSTFFTEAENVVNVIRSLKDCTNDKHGLVLVTDQCLNEDFCLMSRLDAEYVFINFTDVLR